MHTFFVMPAPPKVDNCQEEEPQSFQSVTARILSSHPTAKIAGPQEARRKIPEPKLLTIL
jgi:hypothetical protein